MRWKEVKVGDVIDGCTITDVEDELDWEGRLNCKSFEFDLPNKNGWSFVEIFSIDFENEAELKFENDSEENYQLDLFGEC